MGEQGMQKTIAVALVFMAASFNVAQAHHSYTPHIITKAERREAIERYCGEGPPGPAYKQCLKAHAKQQDIAAFRAIKYFCGLDDKELKIKRQQRAYHDLARMHGRQGRCYELFAPLQRNPVREWVLEEAGIARWWKELANKAGGYKVSVR